MNILLSKTIFNRQKYPSLHSCLQIERGGLGRGWSPVNIYRKSNSVWFDMNFFEVWFIKIFRSCHWWQFGFSFFTWSHTDCNNKNNIYLMTLKPKHLFYDSNTKLNSHDATSGRRCQWTFKETMAEGSGQLAKRMKNMPRVLDSFDCRFRNAKVIVFHVAEKFSELLQNYGSLSFRSWAYLLNILSLFAICWKSFQQKAKKKKLDVFSMQSSENKIL